MPRSQRETHITDGKHASLVIYVRRNTHPQGYMCGKHDTWGKTYHCDIGFSEIQSHIKIKESSIISIHHNQVRNYFTMFPCTKMLYPFCIFQYFSNRTLRQSKFSIIFHNNQNNSKRCYSQMFLASIMLIVTGYISQSAFNNMIPTDVNNWFIKYSSNSININNDQSISSVHVMIK